MPPWSTRSSPPRSAPPTAPWSTPPSTPWSTPEHADPARAVVRYSAFAALFGAIGSLISALWIPGWPGATLALAPGVALAVGLNLRHRGIFVRNLTLFGLAAGAAELAADAWLVNITGTLVYPAGPRLWASPAYMPIAWFGMMSAASALTIALSRRLSLATAGILTALVLGVYIPIYEAIAAAAGWWRYQGTPMLAGVVPHYIILGEVLLALPFVWLTARLVRASVVGALALGIAEGLWIGASYYLAFQVVG